MHRTLWSAVVFVVGIITLATALFVASPHTRASSAITVTTTCAVVGSAQGGTATFHGVAPADRLSIDGQTPINVPSSPFTYGPVGVGTHTYIDTDVATEPPVVVGRGSFTVAACAVPTPELTPLPIPDTGAGRG